MLSEYPSLSLVIAGKLTQGQGTETLDVLNPATEELLGALPVVTQTDLDEALDAAHRSLTTWSAVPAVDRGAILVRAASLIRERADEIAVIATVESGKTLQETRIEVQMAAGTFQWFGEEARRIYGRVIQAHGESHRMYTRKEPVGSVAAFSPWNFPVANPARKLAPALAAGCPVILKPAEETPATALAIYGCLADAGLPKGVVSIVFGHPEMISKHLIASEVIRKISFTGSIAVGRSLAAMAAALGKTSTMELGGHAPVIIAKDADIEKAVQLGAASKFRNAGQVCVAPTRFYIEKPVFDQFTERFVEFVRNLTVGDGCHDGVAMGPMIAERRCAAMEGLVSDALDHGAHLKTGGKRRTGKGFFFEPTVLAHIPAAAKVMQEEPFGPLALLNPVDNVEEAVRLANALPYGLAAYGFTSSNHTALYLEEALEAGMVSVNTTRLSVPESPFGGVKASGHGSEEGVEGLNEFLVTKFVSSTV